MEEAYHIPALLTETVDGLDIRQGGRYVDGTFGGGGHSNEILRRLDGTGMLFGLDQDEDAIRNYEKTQGEKAGLTLIEGNFRYLKNFMRYENALPIDGIVADLGVSFHDFDTMERGFSFRGEGNERLDMRMNQRSSLTAADIVNERDEEELSNLFYLYGELKESRQLARRIVKWRNTNRIETVGEFIAATGIDKADKKRMSRVFQALRIEVNDEMGALKDLLEQSVECLREGGRLVILTYHSLEDRMVKNFMKSGNVEGKVEKDMFGNVISPMNMLTKKPIEASEEEVARNPRSRSAKLRIAELRSKR